MKKKDGKVIVTCTNCPLGCEVTFEVTDDEEIVNLEGAQCDSGITYAKEEYFNPTRTLPTTAKVKGGKLPLVPVKSADPLPKSRLEDAMEVIAQAELEAPVELGDVAVENILDTGVDIIATRNLAAAEE